ncbi:MAG TPA: hypothetical protein VMH02_03250 [Verrucomicrobiae bacterium]|nr:hypothetical protein [Verrucomicrobiae bacterium]
MWNLAGLLLAGALAAAALWRSRAAAGFYDGAVYAMTPKVHRRYALAGAAFAALFAVNLALRSDAATTLELGALVLVTILYATSFLRGAVESDE